MWYWYCATCITYLQVSFKILFITNLWCSSKNGTYAIVHVSVESFVNTQFILTFSFPSCLIRNVSCTFHHYSLNSPAVLTGLLIGVSLSKAHIDHDNGPRTGNNCWYVGIIDPRLLHTHSWNSCTPWNAPCIPIYYCQSRVWQRDCEGTWTAKDWS